MAYTIRLTARNEGIEYRNEQGPYWFNVALQGREWTLFVPGSKWLGSPEQPHPMSPDELQLIVPQLINYLSSIRWVGLFRRRYTVRVVSEGTG